MSDPRFYITTPIYYVNDRPHIGHAYTTVLADVLARYHRLLGEDTFFLTGTDEHGQKVEQAARDAGITPQEHVDRTVVPFKELWARLGIAHDHFIRTTDAEHKRVVQRTLTTLREKGEVYKDSYDGWYCVGCERFYTEKELVEGRCPKAECRREVERIEETNYFFRMSKYQDWLVRYIEDHPRFIQPDFRRNETLGFLRRPLSDLCITRPKERLSWGIELPFDTDYVTYVWFDALINYLTGAGYLEDPSRFEKWWPASVHLIGKDILTTHTVYWPTMLRAMDLPLPQTIYAHGWWLSGESKMSKSAGNVVDPMDMLERCGADAFRYYVVAAMTMGQDASFTEESFTNRFNADLANDLGNLLSRIVDMTLRFADGRMPDGAGTGPGEGEGAELWRTVQEAADGMAAAVAGLRLEQGVARALEAVRAINRYLERRQPWSQAKQADTRPLAVTLYTAAESLRVVSGLLHPVMPEKMGALRQALGTPTAEPVPEDLNRWGVLVPGTPLRRVRALFPRTKPEGPRSKQPCPKPSAARQPEAAALIAVEEFARVDLRTAKVLKAEPVPGTSKLLRLEIMVGSERRQIVAGIAQHYTPESLIGVTIVVVANLKPATIRGLQSEGMLLAASKGESLRLITVYGEISSGARVG
jgi:methionyl-tRNA synthetase